MFTASGFVGTGLGAMSWGLEVDDKACEGNEDFMQLTASSRLVGDGASPRSLGSGCVCAVVVACWFELKKSTPLRGQSICSRSGQGSGLCFLQVLYKYTGLQGLHKTGLKGGGWDSNLFVVLTSTDGV